MTKLPIPVLAVILFAVFFVNLVANAAPQCQDQFSDRQADRIEWGRRMMSMGDYEKAAWAAESASVMSSTPNVEALLLQAEAYVGLKAFEEAYSITERVLIIEGQNHLDALIVKLHALIGMGKVSDAQNTLAQVRAIRGHLIPNEIQIEQNLFSNE